MVAGINRNVQGISISAFQARKICQKHNLLSAVSNPKCPSTKNFQHILQSQRFCKMSLQALPGFWDSPSGT